jgi:hypothetical protein
MSDSLLDQSLNCLRHLHPEWGDRTLLDVFNRLLAKNVTPPGWTKNTHFTFQPSQIRSRRETWTTDQLGKLDRGHSDASGDDFDCPIVIVEYQGKQRVLDGNHRINRWVASGDARLHNVNIHTIDAIGQVVNLPPTT